MRTARRPRPSLGALCLCPARPPTSPCPAAPPLCPQLSAIDRVRIYGPPPSAPQGRAALASFNVEGIHPTDLSTILDQVGAADLPHKTFILAPSYQYSAETGF